MPFDANRLRGYKVPAVLGSAVVTAGMWIFAFMGPATPRLHVVWGMILAGLGMGLLQPVYSVAVQNVAPRAQMGAATASTIFFRAIGSTNACTCALGREPSRRSA